jgi:cyclic pyranopterin monophosphate synthase
LKSRTDATNLPKMVDISEKPAVRREAIAEGTINLRKETIALIKQKRIEKGDPFEIASVGAIQAVKNTSSTLMMCHPIQIESSSIDFFKTPTSVTVRAKVVAISKTGVEMEALNAVSAALLNFWDVVKKYEKDGKGQYPATSIKNIHVVRKRKEGYY